MRRLCVLFVLGMFCSVASASEGQWHGISKGNAEHPHAKGGCASKGKIAQFHKFRSGKGKQVKVPSETTDFSKKSSKVITLDQFI